MRLLVAGGTGFVGRKLCMALAMTGYELHVLVRKSEDLPFPCKTFEWAPEAGKIPLGAFNGVNAIINLAGSPIADLRWSPLVKEKILNSRVHATQTLLSGLNSSEAPQVQTFINASAVGYYGDRADEHLTEQSSKGTGFLADVCERWEQTLLVHPSTVRKVILRVGIVLGPGGGVLNKLVPLFQMGVGGRVGSGKQWMSWIHWKDLVRLIMYTLETPSMFEVVNAVAPAPVQNEEFVKTLAKTLGVSARVPAPAFALKLILGEMSTIVLGSQKVSCEKLLKSGFKFEFLSLAPALKEIFSVELS